MSIDFDRLDTAITHAVEHPDEFGMSTWIRKTATGIVACLAGTVALLAGYQPDFGPFNRTAMVRLGDGPTLGVDVVAIELLGLDDRQAEKAFCALGDITEVIQLRNAWALEAGIQERTWERGQE